MTDDRTVEIISALGRLEAGQNDLKTRLFGNEGAEAGIIGKLDSRMGNVERWQTRAAGKVAGITMAISAFFSACVFIIENWFRFKSRP